MEKRYDVRSFGVRYICDRCGQGEMLALQGTQAYYQDNGRILVRHVCNVCHQMGSFSEKYPTVRYEDIPGQGVPQTLNNNMGQQQGFNGVPQQQQHMQQQQPQQMQQSPQFANSMTPNGMNPTGNTGIQQQVLPNGTQFPPKV